MKVILQNVIIMNYSDDASDLELRYHADNDQDFVLMFDRVAVDAAEKDSGLKRHGKTG